MCSTFAARGDLKLAHTDPNISTSGLSAVYSEFELASRAVGQRLTPRTVDDPAILGRVEQWEHGVAHYVDIAKDFRDLWCSRGSQFADAAYMQETTFLELNKECGAQFTAIYPTDARSCAGLSLLRRPRTMGYGCGAGGCESLR